MTTSTRLLAIPAAAVLLAACGSGSVSGGSSSAAQDQPAASAAKADPADSSPEDGYLFLDQTCSLTGGRFVGKATLETTMSVAHQVDVTGTWQQDGGKPVRTTKRVTIPAASLTQAQTVAVSLDLAATPHQVADYEAAGQDACRVGAHQLD